MGKGIMSGAHIQYWPESAPNTHQTYEFAIDLDSSCCLKLNTRVWTSFAPFLFFLISSLYALIYSIPLYIHTILI